MYEILCNFVWTITHCHLLLNTNYSEAIDDTKMNRLLLLTIGLLWGAISFAQQQDSTIELAVSHPAGYYRDTLILKLEASNKQAKIYYTTDGALPSTKSKPYTKPLTLGATKVVRAIAMLNSVKSDVVTNLYIVREDSSTLPVVSVCIPHGALFNQATGLFVKGSKAGSKFPYKGANYYSRREVPCYVEILEADKKEVFEAKVGFKIFGGMSRIFPQKSFSLYASKSRYGKKYIDYPIFTDRKQSKYKRLVLRNSGSDYGETHFRDALITSFGRDMGLETQAYRPAVVYINGRYWGLYNFREKLTRHYIHEHFGYDKDSINLIEHRKDVQAGSRKHYDRMRMFMRKNNLADQENFDHVASMMDVDNFMEYQILQIYIDNQDAGGNIKFWKPETEDGRWRWILFDTDFGLGHYGRNGHTNNSLAFHTKPNGPIWPNPPWSTLNLRALLQNRGFQERFISRFLDRMNYTLDSTRIIKRIDEYAARIEPEMERHWERWNLASRRWYREIKRMKKFSRERPAYMRQFLKERFPWVGEEVELATSVDSGGYVMVNTVIPAKGNFNGIYFQELPVVLDAKPYFGYQFSHWEMGGEKIEGRHLQMRFHGKKQVIKAVFKKGEHPAAQQMIINEVSVYDQASSDWIEFYNATEEDLDVTGWTIQDRADNQFVFPAGTTIKGNNYLVVCKKEDKFKAAFPTSKNYIGGLSFGLDNQKDIIMVYDAEGLPVDSIGYKIRRKDVKKIKTLVLRDFKSDNKESSNWERLDRNGSPASVNPEYVAIKEKADWELFIKRVKIGGVTTALFILIVMGYVVTQKRLKSKDEE